MASVFDIYGKMEEYFPERLAEDFDNCGFLVGHSEIPVNTVLISLDITDEVINEAHNLGAQLIISHHPLFFKNTANSITDRTDTGRRILKLAELGIAAVCMHTNADSADGGVNDLLAETVGLCDVENLGGGDSGCLGRIGMLKTAVSLREYAQSVKLALKASGLRIADGGKKCSRVAVGGGSCGDFIRLAASMGADTFITADVKYHIFKDAHTLGINLIDAGHFATENMICGRFYDIITREFPSVKAYISQTNCDPTEFC